MKRKAEAEEANVKALAEMQTKELEELNADFDLFKERSNEPQLN
jgi:hypothetical protein